MPIAYDRPAPAEALLCWTLHEAGAARDMESLIGSYCAMLLALGVPLKRANLPVRTLHPLARGARGFSDATPCS